MIQAKLLQAGIDNVSTRTIVMEHAPDTIPHDEVLAPHLELTVLHIAAWTGDAETIQEIKLRRPAVNPDLRTAGGFTALHLAASRGHSGVLRELVSWPGLIHAEGVQYSNEGFTPLHLAAHGGYTECVELLLDVSDVNDQDDIFGRTALHFAALRAHEDVVNLLTSVPDADVRCKDKVRDLTPFLLAAMQPKGRCSSSLIKRLLDTDPEQINDKVGTFTGQMTNVVSRFCNESWRELTRIDIDNSMRPIPEVDDKVEQNESDLYRRFSVPMDGHTALHLASTQNNAELVTELVRHPDILLNERDARFGMTPLHCAIRTSAMDAFSTLMEVDKINVNAKLAKAGRCRRPSWLPPARAFADMEERNLMFLKGFSRYDTPLHLAIRVCQPEDLCEMVIDFCNHPAFNPAIYNKGRMPSLGLAWGRLMVCGRSPPLSEFRRKVSTDPRRASLEKYQYQDKVSLNRATDMLERHPSNASIMNEIAGTRRAAQDSVNAFLVTATLLAGLTFSAYLQPPFGTDVGEYRKIPARLFWTANGLSFYFAVYTILCSLLYIMRSDRRSFNTITDARAHYVALIRIHGAVPLTVSVGFGIGAFVAAGYANLPPQSTSLMLACTVSGLFLVLLQLLRNLYLAFSTLTESLLDYVENPTRGDYLFILFLLAGGNVLFAIDWGNIMFYRRTSGKINTVAEEVNSNSILSMTIPVIQLYTAAAVVMYAVIQVLT